MFFDFITNYTDSFDEIYEGLLVAFFSEKKTLKIFNVSLINDIVSFEQLGPDLLFLLQGRSCLYANTQINIQILSKSHNFNRRMRICMLKFCKLDKILILTAYRHENMNKPLDEFKEYETSFCITCKLPYCTPAVALCMGFHCIK